MPRTWRTNILFSKLETCKEFGITLMEFLKQPEEHQGLMIGFLEVKRRMQVVEREEERKRRWILKGK